MSYPEHERLQAVREKSQSIGEFVEWLWDVKKIVFCERGDELYLTHINVEKTLAEFFGIDLNKLEAEKQDMLERLREANRTGHMEPKFPEFTDPRMKGFVDSLFTEAKKDAHGKK